MPGVVSADSELDDDASLWVVNDTCVWCAKLDDGMTDEPATLPPAPCVAVLVVLVPSIVGVLAVVEPLLLLLPLVVVDVDVVVGGGIDDDAVVVLLPVLLVVVVLRPDAVVDMNDVN
jgi:hypothetical protein